MFVEKSGDRADGLTGLAELCAEHLKDVDHAVPDLQLDIDAGRPRLVREHRGVTEYRFTVADLNQERGQAREDSRKRRGEGATGIAALAEIIPGKRKDHRPLVDRIG